MIRGTKDRPPVKSLKRVVTPGSSSSLLTARKFYNQEEFTTVVKEVENIVNDRPLTYQSNDPIDQPLTSSQLLWGRNLPIMPPLLQPNTDDDSTTEAKELRHRYFIISNALDRFRKRWSEEHLTSLREKHANRCAEKSTHPLMPGSLITVRHDNMHRYEWPLGRVVRVFPNPLGVIRTAEVEEGGQSSIRSVTFLVPLELDYYDEEEGDIFEAEGAGYYNKAASSEADTPLHNEESTTSGHGSPISLGVDSTSTGPSKCPQVVTADMQLSGLYEITMYESVDQVERDSTSPTQRTSVGTFPSTSTEKRVSDSPQPTTTSRELVTHSDAAQPDELLTQRLPR